MLNKEHTNAQVTLSCSKPQTQHHQRHTHSNVYELEFGVIVCALRFYDLSLEFKETKNSILFDVVAMTTNISLFINHNSTC